MAGIGVELRSTWWLMTIYAALSGIVTAAMLVRQDGQPWPRALAAAAVILASLGWLFELRGYRSRWLVVGIEAAAVFLATVSFPIPDRAKGLMFPIVARRGVCASSRSAVVVGLLVNSLSFTAAAIMSRATRHPVAPSLGETLFSLIPSVVIVSVTMRMLVEGTTARAAAEHSAAATSAALTAVVDASPVGLMLVDSAGAVHLCNRNAGRVFGIAGERDRDHDPCRSQDQGPDGETGHRSLIPPAALAGKALVDFEVNGWQRPDGSRVDLTISTAAVPGTDQVVAVVCDVTDRRRMQDQLRRQALHDELTGLANRTLFLDKIAGALASSASMADPTAVLLLDLDAFKTVNDTLGHAAGDLLLVEVAERLRVCLRPQDTLARLGGDEFAVLLKSSGQAEAAMVAKRVLAAFEQPIRICSAEEATTEVRVRVSLGAVVAERETEADASALLRSADMAMYAAKRAGGHRWAVFEPAMQQRLRERVALEEALRRAVVAEGLRLYYQPCVDLDTAEIRSAEALLRWTDPGRGAVPPRQFIPIAEDTGMIVQIGRWALQEACRQASGWQTPTGSSLTVAVNLSVRQLTDPSLVNDIRDALTESGLPAQCLVLELTESELADDTVLPVLRHLKALGVRLALDDFGTGYSSLAYLRRFPLDILKIDRAFVTPITSDPSAAALTRSIIDMAHTLGLETVAEGVESEEQAALLRGMECQRAQGFLFARPQPPDVLAAELLRRANHQVAPG